MRYAIQLTPGTRPGRDLSTTLRLERGSAGLREVEIPITSCDGSPGAGATVTLGGQTVIADAAGIARFTLAPGRYTLTISGLGTPAISGTPDTPAADFLLDNFTGTGALSGHTSDSGHTWTPSPLVWNNQTENATLSGGKVYADLPNVNWGAYSNAVPPSADYYAEIIAAMDPTKTQDGILAIRWTPTGGGTGEGVGYLLRFFLVTATHLGTRLYRHNGGGGANDSWSGINSPVGAVSSFAVRIQAVGSTITVSVDGTEVINVTDSAVSQVGTIAAALVGDAADPSANAYDSLRAYSDVVSGTPDIPATGCAPYSETITIP